MKEVNDHELVEGNNLEMVDQKCHHIILKEFI